MRYTLDVTAGLAFGTDINTIDGDSAVVRHLNRMFPMIHRRVNTPIPYWRYLRLPADRSFDPFALTPLPTLRVKRMSAYEHPSRFASASAVSASPLNVDVIGLPFGDCASRSATSPGRISAPTGSCVRHSTPSWNAPSR